MKYYIILGQARSGTSVVHLLLRNHPEISALYDEVNYSPFYDRGLSIFTHGLDEAEEVKKAFPKLYELLACLNNNELTKACGLKTAVNTEKAAKTVVETIKNYLSYVKIILIKRENLTDQYASLIRAQKTGSWHSWQKNVNHISPMIKFREREFIDYVKMSLTINDLLETLKDTNEVIHFYYERDIFPNKIENYYKLFDFLGVSRLDLEIPLQKVAKPAQEFVKKYEYWRKLEEQIKIQIK